MKRIRFVKNVMGIGLLSAVGCKIDCGEKSVIPNETDQKLKKREDAEKLREELIAAWHKSEKMTMANIEQMPPEFFSFKYTKEAMSFSEQWRHCIIYTCGQLAGRADINNPYEGVKLPVQMPKEDILKELKNLYNHVRQAIKYLSYDKLISDCDFAGETIPVWRLFYAMENHIIHHRGQSIVYLRLKGIVPKGYYGW